MFIVKMLVIEVARFDLWRSFGGSGFALHWRRSGTMGRRLGRRGGRVNRIAPTVAVTALRHIGDHQLMLDPAAQWAIGGLIVFDAPLPRHDAGPGGALAGGRLGWRDHRDGRAGGAGSLRGGLPDCRIGCADCRRRMGRTGCRHGQCCERRAVRIGHHDRTFARHLGQIFWPDCDDFDPVGDLTV